MALTDKTVTEDGVVYVYNRVTPVQVINTGERDIQMVYLQVLAPGYYHQVE